MALIFRSLYDMVIGNDARHHIFIRLYHGIMI